MDGFIDKFAQRKNAQNMIRANAMAEAEEKERMALKISEYEMAIQEMRQSSLQNIENAEKVKELLAAGLDKIEEVQKKDEGASRESERMIKEVKEQLSELLSAQREMLEKQSTQMQELAETQKTAMEELLHGTEDFNHKEAVKVYRNVQAVVEAELPKQTEEIKNAMKEKSASKGFMAVWVLTLIGVIANIVIEVLRLLGYL